jgi:HJR/Mrr/RecB family endonuclease
VTKPVTIYLPQAVHPQLGKRSFDLLLHDLLDEKRALSREIVVPVQFGDQDFQELFDKSIGGDDQSTTNPFDRIDGMDWRDFELWVAEQLKRAGFHVQVGPGTGDGGVDVIALRADGAGRQVFVQCEHSGKGAKSIQDESAVREVLRAWDNRRSSPHVILAAATNGRFSLAAENLVKEHSVHLFNRSRWFRMGRILAGQCGQTVLAE